MTFLGQLDLDGLLLPDSLRMGTLKTLTIGVCIYIKSSKYKQIMENLKCTVSVMLWYRKKWYAVCTVCVLVMF